MNRTELTALFKKHYKPLRSNLGFRCGIPAAEVDDIAQEVFLRLLRYTDIEISKNPLAYVLKVGANVASEWRQLKRNRIIKSSELLDDLPVEDNDSDPHIAVETQQLNAAVQKMIDEMPERRRTILLTYMNSDSMTYPQLAAALGVSERIVMRELVKAYAKLRQELFK